jgi:hypothetical protein
MQTSIIQIFKVNEPRAWAFEGKTGTSHSAECALLSADGSIEQVGVLKLKGDELVAKAKPGTYTGAFSLRANPASRVIEAVLTDLTPIPPQTRQPAKV